jgi:hypothetical protein
MSKLKETTEGFSFHHSLHIATTTAMDAMALCCILLQERVSDSHSLLYNAEHS